MSTRDGLRELIAKLPHVYVDGPNCGFRFDNGKACGEPTDGRHHIKYGSHLEISWMHEFEPEQVHSLDCATCRLEAALAADASASPPDAKAGARPMKTQRKAKRGPISQMIDELEGQYRWKAENIVRFFKHLGMTEQQKVEFLAREFATIHWTAQIHRERGLNG